MPSSGMLRRVAIVRTDVSKERSASIIRVTRISELETTLAVDGILRSHRRENHKSYINEAYYLNLIQVILNDSFNLNDCVQWLVPCPIQTLISLHALNKSRFLVIKSQTCYAINVFALHAPVVRISIPSIIYGQFVPSIQFISCLSNTLRDRTRHCCRP
jgi:hypothetical protein